MAKKHETIHERNKKFYMHRDLQGDGIGEYFYKKFRYDSFCEWINKQWIEPGCPGDNVEVELFETKEELLKALGAAVA